MNDSHKLIYCHNCLGFMPHETLHDDYVECCGCGEQKSLNDSEIVEAEQMTHCDPRRA